MSKMAEASRVRPRESEIASNLAPSYAARKAEISAKKARPVPLEVAWLESSELGCVGRLGVAALPGRKASNDACKRDLVGVSCAYAGLWSLQNGFGICLLLILGLARSLFREFRNENVYGTANLLVGKHPGSM